MPTMTTPSVDASEPKGSPSSAIHKGADLVVALFEAEKAKVVATSLQTLKALEAHFSNFQLVSQSSIDEYARRCTDSEAALRTAQAAQAQAVAEGSLAQEKMLAAQQQLARVQRELENFKAFSKFSRNNNTLNFSSEQAPDAAATTGVQDVEVQTADADLHMLIMLGDTRRQLVATQQLLEEKEWNCKTVEKERDNMKAAMGVEIMILKHRILSLQTEAELLRISQEGRRDNDAPATIPTPAARTDTRQSLGSTIVSGDMSKQSTSDDLRPAKALHPYPAHFAVASSARETPDQNSGQAKATSNSSPEKPSTMLEPRGISTASDPTSKMSRSTTALSSMNSMTSSSSSASQINDNSSSSKRPASTPIGSSLSVKRAKLDHSSHANSPTHISGGPYPPPIATTDGSNMLPAVGREASDGNSVQPSQAVQFTSNQSATEAKMKKQLLSKVLESELPAKTNVLPSVSDKPKPEPSSRPKPKPAYLDRSDIHSNSARSEVTHTSAVPKSAPCTHPASRPKPKPAYLGSNSACSGSTRDDTHSNAVVKSVSFSRPKPKPAYLGSNPAQSSPASDDINGNAITKTSSLSRPKPKPAYLGSNSASSSSASSNAPGPTD